MSGFALHGIDHLSASSLNSAATQLPIWIMERLLNRKSPVGCAAHRGTAIEAGVQVGLLYPDKSIEDCQQIAIQRYDGLTAMSGDPRRQQERDAVSPTVEKSLAELRQYGIPDEVQHKIEKPLGDGLPHLIGFVDFGWTQHGITLDLKTSLRLTSQISTAHGRQVAGYIHQTNREGRVAYCTPKKVGVYPLDRPDERFDELRIIAQRLDRFLSISKDAAELAALVIPDADHFYYNEPTAAANRREVYGF